ncbi:hypothetical protein C488_14847 [Natrinema pellirubrum DSM 15624]|uniref:Uncharacterized protein n=1 Tax=Natrinema pellirubrum (strain DSM 15624 / CIP 106293 / JCM 10476 / NCIMB 786 / 157) TaxID=797303 RepID=L9YGE1_NATP1|nr:hypothetical protein C488_14847 [Natrinema pellirubrum DSM 15624]
MCENIVEYRRTAVIKLDTPEGADVHLRKITTLEVDLIRGLFTVFVKGNYPINSCVNLSLGSNLEKGFLSGIILNDSLARKIIFI